jgi:hypothetical protein
MIDSEAIRYVHVLLGENAGAPAVQSIHADQILLFATT